MTRNRLFASLASILIVALGGERICAQTSVDWSDRTSIQGQVGHGLAFDQARERVVMFGDGQTWEWDGSDWFRRTPIHSPPRLHEPAMTYDPTRKRTVLFGVVIPRSTVATTWEWDGSDWRQRLPQRSPPARHGHAMCYDVNRQRIVLFGGHQSGTAFNDTWEWDGGNWTQRTPSRKPTARGWHAMSYDATRRRVVLFGGQLRSDTWEWDGSNWTRRNPARKPPSGMFAPAMGYDAGRRRVVLLGGADTWEWDGSNWSSIKSSSRPTAEGGEMAFDSARGELLLFGGGYVGGWVPAPNHPVMTWKWDGVQWSQRHVGDGHQTSPHSGAFDSKRNVFVSYSSYPRSVDTREWDGRRWRHRGVGPFFRRDPAMAFDASRSVTVMFGGEIDTGAGRYVIDDTFEWDGKTWRDRKPVRKPPARDRHAMAFDSRRGRTVLFGGSDAFSGPPSFNDTWEWDGTNWQQRRSPTAPSPRMGHAMAYDVIGQRIVLHGGQGARGLLADAWQWDGTSWRPIPSSHLPPAASNHAMCWDPSRNKVVLYVADQLWELGGSQWNRVALGLANVNGGSMAYDAVRKALMVTGAHTTRWIGTVARGSAQRVGLGCTGSAGVPLLTSEAPRLGEPHRLVLDGARANALTLFALSNVQTTTPLGGGCSLYLGGSFLTFTAMSSCYGHAELGVTIPFVAALRGQTFYAQAVVADSGGAGGGFSMSAALRLVVGD